MILHLELRRRTFSEAIEARETADSMRMWSESIVGPPNILMDGKVLVQNGKSGKSDDDDQKERLRKLMEAMTLV